MAHIYRTRIESGLSEQMIKYALKCSNDHSFESWFQSADAFDTLHRRGLVNCSVCGTGDVSKSVMAPRIGKSDDAAEERPLSAPATPAEQAVREMRAHLEANSENVGKNFAYEARAIHNGDAPERSIYGEAKLQDAKKLIDDGIPVAPLPFVGPRKSN